MFLFARLGSNMLPSTSSLAGLRCCDISVAALTHTSGLRRPLAGHLLQLLCMGTMRGAACQASGATCPACALEIVAGTANLPHALRVTNILLTQCDTEGLGKLQALATARPCIQKNRRSEKQCFCALVAPTHQAPKPPT